MAQLRADIHQTENEKKRKCESKKLQLLLIIKQNNQEINNENEESQANVQEMLEDLQDETGYITTEEDWQERLEECSYTHPAVDINAKWDLRDIFIRELEKPEFISLSSEFN
ncbi:unnamed protein product [Rhizophagus irregularis]|nr:unnamed protein product [Rhizophagus irregularis]